MCDIWQVMLRQMSISEFDTACCSMVQSACRVADLPAHEAMR